jgi:hypothetical protein
VFCNASEGRSTSGNGVLLASGTFTRPLAATAAPGNGTVTFAGTTGGGGFAALDKLVVAIGGTASPTTLDWGTPAFCRMERDLCSARRTPASTRWSFATPST